MKTPHVIADEIEASISPAVPHLVRAKMLLWAQDLRGQPVYFPCEKGHKHQTEKAAKKCVHKGDPEKIVRDGRARALKAEAMRRVENMKYREIGEAFGVSANRAMQLVAKGERILRQQAREQASA